VNIRLGKRKKTERFIICFMRGEAHDEVARTLLQDVYQDKRGVL
jgi:hypothetical protein